MRVRIFVTVLLTGSLVGPQVLAQPTPSIPSLSGDQVNRLNAGEVLTSMSTGSEPGSQVGDVMGVVNATTEQVGAVISDFANHKEWLDDLTTSDIVGEEGDQILLHGVTDMPFPMDDRNWTIRTQSGTRTVDGLEVWVSDWTYVEGSGNMDDTQGYWLLIPWGNDGSQTLVRYFIMMDLGSEMPQVLLDWGSENMLPTRIEGLRSRL